MGGITFMPFVRDSKAPGKDSIKSTSAATPAAPAAKAPAAPKAAVAPVVAAAPVAVAISTETVTAALAAATLETLPVPVPAAEKAPKEKKEKKEKVVAAPVVPKVGKAPEVPILPPSYVTPAPVPTTARPVEVKDLSAPVVGTPTVEQVVVDGQVVLAQLEARLKFYSYVGGFLPTAADRNTLALVDPAPDAATYPNVSRWLRNVGSFSAEEAAAWK
jgi:hypothetical protein